jgi:hypothetical protein
MGSGPRRHGVEATVDQALSLPVPEPAESTRPRRFGHAGGAGGPPPGAFRPVARGALPSHARPEVLIIESLSATTGTGRGKR